MASSGMLIKKTCFKEYWGNFEAFFCSCPRHILPWVATLGDDAGRTRTGFGGMVWDYRGKDKHENSYSALELGYVYAL